MSTPTNALTPSAGTTLLDAPETRNYIKRAQAGDVSVLPHLRALLDDHPEIWQHCGELTVLAQDAWLQLIAGDDLLMVESLLRKVTAMKAEMLEPSASPLERLLADRIGICWLQVQAADLGTAQALAQGASAKAPTAEVARKRLDSANYRYLAAVKQLALVRRLLQASTILRLPKPIKTDQPRASPPDQ